MNTGVTIRCNREHGSLDASDIVVLNNEVHCRKCIEGFLVNKQDELKEYVSFTKGLNTEEEEKDGGIQKSL